MPRDRVRYRFINEQPDWNYYDLIDEEPQMQRQREACREERRWSVEPDRPESEAMGLPAVGQGRFYGSYFELNGMLRPEGRKAVWSDPFSSWATRARIPRLPSASWSKARGISSTKTRLARPGQRPRSGWPTGSMDPKAPR